MIRFKLQNIGLFIVWVLLTLLSILVGAVYLLFGARGDPMNVLISRTRLGTRSSTGRRTRRSAPGPTARR